MDPFEKEEHISNSITRQMTVRGSRTDKNEAKY